MVLPAPAWVNVAGRDSALLVAWPALAQRLTFETGLPAGYTSTGGEPMRVPDTDPLTGTTTSLQPADLGDSTVASVSFPVNVGAAGTMTLRYRVEAENNYDFGNISVDGTRQVRVTGYTGGSTTSSSYVSLDVNVVAGTRTIQLQFEKDSSASLGFDNIRLGSVTYPAALVRYEYRIDGGTPVAVDANQTQIEIIGLTNNQQYTVEVRGVDADGPGAWSAVATGTPVDLGDLLIQDNFDRAASTTSPGIPTLGGPYTVRSGTWGIINNQLYTSVSTASSQITFPAAQDLRVDADFITTNSLALMVRWVDANNHWFWGIRSGTALALMRCIGGTYYQYSNDVTLTAGQRLGLAAFGGKIYGFVNDRLMVQADDPWAATAAPVAGIRINSSTATRVDNLYAELIRVRPGLPADNALAGVLEDQVAAELQIPTFVYKGRDKRSADEGSVA